MHKTWQATLTASGVSAPSVEQYELLLALIAATTSHDSATSAFRLVWRLEAPTLAEATTAALSKAQVAFEKAGIHGTQEEVLIRSADRVEQEAKCPRPQDLVITKDIAEQLGVSRQRVAQLASDHPDFPPPIARTAAGPIYTQESVSLFAAGWERSPASRPTRNKRNQ
ncbi:hypothetical protein ABMX48_32890 [Streptomyces cavourensis]